MRQELPRDGVTQVSRKEHGKQSNTGDRATLINKTQSNKRNNTMQRNEKVQRNALDKTLYKKEKGNL